METEEKLKLAKGASKAIAASCAGLVIKNAVKAYVPGKNRLEQVQILIGGYVLAGMVGDQAITWADQAFDKALNKFQELKKDLKETADE